VKRLLLSILLLTLATALHSAEKASIPFAEKNIKLLGIELGKPVLTKDSSGVPLPARVTIPAGRERVVSAPAAGNVRFIEVATGDEVILHQPLAELASPALLSLQRDYLQAFAAQNLSLQQLKRDKQLAKEGIVSKRRLEETRNQHRNQQLLVKEHTSALKIAGFTNENIQELRNNVTLREALTVRAPLAGVVLEQLAHIGERLEAGAPMFRIADLSTLWLDISVPVHTHVSMGQTISIEDRDVNAKVLLIGRSVDPGSQTYLVRAEIDSSGEQHVRAGEAVNIRLRAPAETQEGILLSLPRSAVVRSGKEHFVFVHSKGHFEARKVHIKGFAGQSVVLSRGLQADDTVAVSGVAAIKAAWQGLGGNE